MTDNDALARANGGESEDLDSIGDHESVRWRFSAWHRPSVRSLIASVLFFGLVVALVGLTVVAINKNDDLEAINVRISDESHAENVALEYAVGAAEMSYEDIPGWLSRLTDNTTPELGDRLRDAAAQMEQLLRPLQWQSLSKPLAAKVVDSADGVYEVDAFAEVVTRNVQAPADGIVTIAAYNITVDKNDGWLITEISSNGTQLDSGGGPFAEDQGDGGD